MSCHDVITVTWFSRLMMRRLYLGCVLYPSGSLSCPSLHAVHVDWHQTGCLSDLTASSSFRPDTHACSCTGTATWLEYLVLIAHVNTCTESITKMSSTGLVIMPSCCNTAYICCFMHEVLFGNANCMLSMAFSVTLYKLFVNNLRSLWAEWLFAQCAMWQPTAACATEPLVTITKETKTHVQKIKNE